MALPVDAWKLEGISPRAYQHPADRAATAALHKVPYLDEVVRRLIALGYERALRAAALGSSVRLGQEQLPHIWVLHRQSFNALDLEDVPDLYMTQLPFANAATIGVDRPVVVLNSELVRILDDDGRRAVLAHEAAHVHSGHVLYQTAMLILLRVATGVRLPLLAGLPLLAIQLALLEWFRGAELSCDRAAALVTRDPMAICRALMVISAGEASADLNLDAFVAQAMDYSEGGKGLEKLTRLMADMGLTHPMPVRRVRLLLEWVREGGYDRIVSGDYIRRGHEPPLREETDAAQEHYAKRVSDAFRQAGLSIGEVGQQLERLAGAPARRRRRRRHVQGRLGRGGLVGVAQALHASAQHPADLHLRHAHAAGDLALGQVAGEVQPHDVALERLEQGRELVEPCAVEGPAQPLVLRPELIADGAVLGVGMGRGVERQRPASAARVLGGDDALDREVEVLGEVRRGRRVAERRAQALGGREQLEPRLGRLARRAHGPGVVAQPAAHLADHGRHGVAQEVGAEGGIEAFERLRQAQRGGLLEVLDIARVAIATGQPPHDRPHRATSSSRAARSPCRRIDAAGRLRPCPRRIGCGGWWFA